MRDSNRIDEFCQRLAVQWKKVPDWRFGQLISNITRNYKHFHGDIFFPEDDVLIEFIEDYFKEKNGR